MPRPRKAGASSSGAMRPYAAFLRGINVGGRNLLPMAHLVRLFDEAGCANVRTWIQSGNVAFAASPECAARVADSVRQSLADSFGVNSPVILRSAAELESIIASNPFLKPGRTAPHESELHICFLADKPRAKRVAALDPQRSPGDEFIVRGREIYFRLPNGLGRSRLTNAWFDSVLQTTSTFRNWRTLLKMRDLLATM